MSYSNFSNPEFNLIQISQKSSDSEVFEDRDDISATPHRPPASITFSPQTQARGPIDTVAIAAKDLVRTVEVLNGQDDVRVQDFIRSVKRAKLGVLNRIYC